MTTERGFFQRIKNSYVYGYQAGKEESKDEGKKEQAFETARALLELGVSTDIIAKSGHVDIWGDRFRSKCPHDQLFLSFNTVFWGDVVPPISWFQ